MLSEQFPYSDSNVQYYQHSRNTRVNLGTSISTLFIFIASPSIKAYKYLSPN